MKKMSEATRPLKSDVVETHAERGGSFDGDASDIVLDASRRIALIYADLMQAGLSDELVGRAMIGATIQLYDAMGLAPHLPDILRRVADNVEAELLDKQPVQN